MSHAEAYKDPGTPQEQSRRTFMANATLAVGGVIGLVIGVPVVAYLIPSKDVLNSSGREFSPVQEADWKKLVAESASDTPVKIFFRHSVHDAYIPTEVLEDYVWGVKMSAADLDAMKTNRPDLFNNPGGKVDYDIGEKVGEVGFVVFSSICPHLGCKFGWDVDKKHFLCPCHNSEFERDGKKIEGKGPAARGLDPLPLREQNGKAEVTWIRYKSEIPDRVIISYS